jgi:hypothetical protein
MKNPCKRSISLNIPISVCPAYFQLILDNPTGNWIKIHLQALDNTQQHSTLHFSDNIQVH